MSTLSPAQIAGHAYAAGFRGKALVNAVAVALAESGGRTDAVGVNSDRWHSRDRGLWQINSHWHPEVSDAEAFNPASAARAAYRISSGGGSWSPWATWPVSANVQRGRATAGVAKYLQSRGLSGSASAGAAGSGSGSTTAAGDEFTALDALSLPGDVVGAVLKVSNPLEAAKQAVFLMAKAGMWMADPHNWLRVVMVTGGGVAVLAGIGMLAKSGAAGQAAQGAANAATGAAKTGIGAGVAAATGGTSAAVKAGAAVAASTAKSAGKGTAAAASDAAKLVKA